MLLGAQAQEQFQGNDKDKDKDIIRLNKISKVTTAMTTVAVMPSKPIEVINQQFPLELSKFSILDEDSVLSMEISPDGGLMASMSQCGHVKIWQVLNDQVEREREGKEWPLLRILRDDQEEHIEEFFTGTFLPGGRFAVAGKRKDRFKWDEGADDGFNLPGIIKIFDLSSGKCVNRLLSLSFSFPSNSNSNQGHSEEILFIRPISTSNHENFLISCGQDGKLCRWSFDPRWRTCLSVDSVKLGQLVFHFDQLCDELIVVAVDDGLQIFDIVQMKHVRSFKTPFTSYCDFVRIIRRTGMKVDLLLRGVELLKVDTHEPSAPNSILIVQINLAEKGGKILQHLQHPLYNANSWLIRLGMTQNAVYIAAPTTTGKILIFNALTGECTANLHTHDDSEVRQVLFHPKLPIMLSCGDDGRIRIYHSAQ